MSLLFRIEQFLIDNDEKASTFGSRFGDVAMVHRIRLGQKPRKARVARIEACLADPSQYPIPLKRLPNEPRPARPPRRTRSQIAREMLAAGKTEREVCELTGLKPDTVESLRYDVSSDGNYEARFRRQTTDASAELARRCNALLERI